MFLSATTAIDKKLLHNTKENPINYSFTASNRVSSRSKYRMERMLEYLACACDKEVKSYSFGKEKDEGNDKMIIKGENKRRHREKVDKDE